MIGRLYILPVMKVGIFNFIYLKTALMQLQPPVFRAFFSTNAVCTHVETVVLLAKKAYNNSKKCSRPNSLYGNCLNSSNGNKA